MEFLRYLESIRNSVFTGVFEFFTLFGEEVVILAILCFFYWCYNKRLAYRICFSYFVSGITIQALKITFRIPRPWILDPEFKPVPSAIETATGYSFPSGHTQSATSLFGTFFLHTKNKLRKILYLVIVLGVVLSRMYLGVHTPLDVGVSFIVSFVLILLVHFVFTDEFLEKRRGICSIVMAVISVAVMVYALYLLYSGKIEEKYAKDCCKAAGAGIGFAIGWYLETGYIKFNENAVSIRMQAMKYTIGILVAVAIKVGLKAIIGDSIPADIIRYIILVLWVTVIFPLIIKKYFIKVVADQAQNQKG